MDLRDEYTPKIWLENLFVAVAEWTKAPDHVDHLVKN